MQRGKFIFSPAAILLLLAVSISVKAEQNQLDGQPTAVDVVAVAPAPLLTDRLAGVKATGETKQFSPDKLSEIAGDKADILREYRVTSATFRKYGSAQVELFEASDRFAAYGLFSFFVEAKATANAAPEIGSGSARASGGLIFHKGRYFVRITGPASNSTQVRLAQEITQKILPSDDDLPPLVKSVSAPAAVAEGRNYKPVMQITRYFLGPQSLASYLERGREMFEFFGDAEAVVVEYTSADATATVNSSAKMVIVEYHTPQFATDAMTRVNSYLDSLPADERDRIVVKRVGNFIVGTVSFTDREFAAQLIDSVEYPYTVKWLRNPLLATNDPFRQHKAAEMLLSTFGILGLILGTVFVFGTAFGAVIFIRRRRQQRQAFSDAGGMLRLDIDPFEAAMLGLPPPRSEE